MKKLITLVLALVCVICLVSCVSENNENEKEVNTITDFSKFADMTKNGTDKIEVTFDNYSGSPYYFTVEDKEDIDEIMNCIFSSSFAKMKKEVNGGDHTSLKIIQSEKEYQLNAFMNKEGEYYYSFATTDLQTKIHELAREAGAFENEENNSLTEEKLFFKSENVKSIFVSSFPEGYEYLFNGEQAKAITDYLSNLKLQKDFEENPNDYGGMTWDISIEYENGDILTVHHFGNMFIRLENGIWYKMNFEEASYFSILLEELNS